jgi:hypothetical protein
MGHLVQIVVTVQDLRGKRTNLTYSSFVRLPINRGISHLQKHPLSVNIRLLDVPVA